MPDSMRDTLFGDLPIDVWGANEAAVEPWLSFARARDAMARGDTKDAVAALAAVTVMPGLESRHSLQAWHFLRGLGQPPPVDVQKQVLGVVVEVSLDTGLDLVAGYADHSARYWNYSGSGVVWDRPDGSLDAAVDALLDAGRAVVVHIGPWEGPRRPPPQPDFERLNMLTPLGICFGEGPFAALAEDPMGGRLLGAATHLMQRLTLLRR
jgi:hypothetical protein